MNDWNWKEHVAIILGVASTLFIAFRLLVITYFDPQTALAVLKSAGTSTVFVGTLMSSLWLIASMAYNYTVWKWELNLIRQEKVIYATATAFSLVVLIATGPLLIVGLALFSLAILFIIQMLLKTIDKKRARKVSGKEHVSNGAAQAGGHLPRLLRRVSATTEIRTSRYMLAMSIFLVLLAIVNPDPWEPIETIKVGSTLRVGYTMDINDSTITILDDKSRKVEYLNIKDRSVERNICDSNTGLSALLSIKPFITFVIGANDRYPKCPKLRK